MDDKKTWNYRMRISYDGTKYQGWQRLKDSDKTIQGKIEDVLTRMSGEQIEINGSGRTDAGVHAIAQVANFKTSTKYSTEDVKGYLNRYLPDDIAVNVVEFAEERFHARLNAKTKTYCYTVNNSGVVDVFRNRYQYFYPEKLDVELMRKAAAELIGTHDFRNFSSIKRTKKSTVRTIHEIDIKEECGIISMTFKGDGFLYNMVRILVGTLVEVGRGRMSLTDVERIFSAEDRTGAGFTAPAKGLMLVEVEY